MTVPANLESPVVLGTNVPVAVGDTHPPGILNRGEVRVPTLEKEKMLVRVEKLAQFLSRYPDKEAPGF